MYTLLVLIHKALCLIRDAQQIKEWNSKCVQKVHNLLCNQLTNIRCSSKKNIIEHIVYKISFSYNRIYKEETISHDHHKDRVDGEGSRIEIKEGHYLFLKKVTIINEGHTGIYKN